MRALSAAEPQNLSVSRRLMRAGWSLGTTLVDTGRPREGERILADARALGEQLKLLEPDDRDLARVVEIVTSAHAQALVALGRFSEARPLLEAAASARRQLWQEAPQDWRHARDYALAEQQLADMWADAGDASNACATYQVALATFARISAAGKGTQLDQDYSLPNIYERVKPLCPALARTIPLAPGHFFGKK